MISRIAARERATFLARHPRCAALAQRGAAHFLYGVPMHWMSDWDTPHPLFARSARGACLVCADGLEHADFCLADTGAMFGHNPVALREALAVQAASGLGAMLAGEAAPEVGELLALRFGLPFWQLALSASDANRFCIRWARGATGRADILVFDGCYHGAVDDTLVDLVDGAARTRPSLLGQVFDIAAHTRVVEFNDVEALARALADRGVACVVAEPALTNSGMVLPQPGFLARLREECTRTGTLLLLDETHTLSAGPAGMSGREGVQPDFLVTGKAIAGGLPCAVYGFTAELAGRMRAAKDGAPPGFSGIGTTLAGNLLALAALRATLLEIATPEAYESMCATCSTLAQGLEDAIASHGLGWSVSRIGARCELQFCARPPSNAREAHAAMDHELERTLHLYLLNRGVLVTPFHNMMLASPATTGTDFTRLLEAFREFLRELAAK